jgi:hypothetical protein
MSAAFLHALSPTGGLIPLNCDADGRMLATVYNFDIPEHDTIELSYTDGNLTGVVYKLSGATVATWTLAYTDGNLVSVTKALISGD